MTSRFGTLKKNTTLKTIKTSKNQGGIIQQRKKLPTKKESLCHNSVTLSSICLLILPMTVLNGLIRRHEILSGNSS